MKFQEARRFDADGLRDLCVIHHYYTSGTNEEYGRLLDKVEECNNLTTEVIAELAEDIIEHTPDLDVETDMEGVMFNIARECMTFFMRCVETERKHIDANEILADIDDL